MSRLQLRGTRIGDLELTEKVHADMRDIAAGRATAEDRLAVVADWVREDIAQMEKNAVAMRISMGLKQTAVAEKECAEGIWATTGQAVRFTRSWGGHRFSDLEVQRLLAGETIEFLSTSQHGTTYDVFGELAEQTFRGKTFVGFKKLGLGRRDASGAAQPPREWYSHVSTPEEIQKVAAGGSVEASDLVSKHGTAFQCKVWFRRSRPARARRSSLTSTPRSATRRSVGASTRSPALSALHWRDEHPREGPDLVEGQQVRRGSHLEGRRRQEDRAGVRMTRAAETERLS